MKKSNILQNAVLATGMLLSAENAFAQDANPPVPTPITQQFHAELATSAYVNQEAIWAHRENLFADVNEVFGETIDNMPQNQLTVWRLCEVLNLGYLTIDGINPRKYDDTDFAYTDEDVKVFIANYYMLLNKLRNAYEQRLAQKNLENAPQEQQDSVLADGSFSDFRGLVLAIMLGRINVHNLTEIQRQAIMEYGFSGVTKNSAIVTWGPNAGFISTEALESAEFEKGQAIPEGKFDSPSQSAHTKSLVGSISALYGERYGLLMEGDFAKVVKGAEFGPGGVDNPRLEK